jgi:hypothetical protein
MAMSIARTEIDVVTLEGVVADWFFQRGIKISSVQIKAVGTDGDWGIGEGTRRGGPDYHSLAREAERHLRPKYKLVHVEVRRLETPPLQS